MKKQIALLLAAVVATGSLSSFAADTTTNAPVVKKHAHSLLPFNGKATAVDAGAMTVTVGSLVLNVTSETKIMKDGKPATLADIKAGETIGGSYKKDEAGKLTAALIRAGEKADKKKKVPTDAPVK